MIMSDFPLTPQQVKIFKYITNYYKRKHYMPSYREIMKHTKHKSTGSINVFIEQLKDRGYIDFQKAKPRSIKILKDLS
jgi:SOS-response transcriptional repressor LexA